MIPIDQYLESITIEEIERDPYPLYARLRKEAPVAYVPALQCWLVTRWEDVQTVTKSPELFTARSPGSPVSIAFGESAIIQCDGETHTHLRNGVAPHYLPGKVKAYIEELVTPIAAEAIDSFSTDGPVDLMSAYFEPISVQCLARTFGLEGVETETLRNWFHGLAMGAINFGSDPERARLCEETISEINRALDPIFSRIEIEHDHTPLSHMLRSGAPEGEVRRREDIMPSVLVTLLGGMQEPGHAAGTTLYALLKDQSFFEAVKLKLDQQLPKAIAEGLRWVAPIGTQVRTALVDVELGGATIPAGAVVSAVLASACHDESRYSNPESFELFREQGGHAAFGFGHHFCVGRWFAQAQIELALSILISRFPDMRLVDPEGVDFFGWEFRAPQTLLVELAA